MRLILIYKECSLQSHLQPTPVAFDKPTQAPFVADTESQQESLSHTPYAIPSQEPLPLSIPTPQKPVAPKNDNNEKVWGTEIEGLNKVDMAQPPKVPNVIEGSVDEVWVLQVTLQLFFVSRLVRQLNPMDIMGFEWIVSESCLEYYASCKNNNDNNNTAATAVVGKKPSGRHLQQGQRQRDARNVIKADIKFVCQELSYDDKNNMPMNVITYDQHFIFVPYTQSNINTAADETNNNVTDDGNDKQDSNLFTWMELAKLPFNEMAWNMRLGNELQENVAALKDIKLPLEVPIVPNQAQFIISSKNYYGKRHKLSEGAVMGIFVIIAAIFTVIAAYGLWQLEIALQPKKKFMKNK